MHISACADSWHKTLWHFCMQAAWDMSATCTVIGTFSRWSRVMRVEWVEWTEPTQWLQPKFLPGWAQMLVDWLSDLGDKCLILSFAGGASARSHRQKILELCWTDRKVNGGTSRSSTTCCAVSRRKVDLLSTREPPFQSNSLDLVDHRCCNARFDWGRYVGPS